MSYRDKRRTVDEKRQSMLRTRTAQQTNALALANDLHDAGFSGLWIESTQVTGDGGYWARVVVDQVDLSSDRFETIVALGEIHSAKVMLLEIRMNQESFSRIALWPQADVDLDDIEDE